MPRSLFSLGIAATLLVVLLGLIITARQTDTTPSGPHPTLRQQPQTTTSVVEPRLETRIRQSNPGDTINLAAGRYGDLRLNDIFLDAPVTVDGNGEAIFRKISLKKVSNLHFRNIVIEAGKTDQPGFHFAFNIMNSRNISIEGSDIGWSADGNWANDGMGMTARLSDSISIRNNVLHDAFIGLVVRDAENILVAGNTFRDIKRDGINVSGTVNIDISENICTDFHPTRPVDHPDCIQFWNDTAERSNENIRIVGNQVLRGSGGVSQGIFMRGLKDGLHHKNVLIENNIIHQGMGQGIYVQKADDVIIRGNRLTPAPPVEFTPMLSIRSPVSNVLIENNDLMQIDISRDLPDGAVILRNNMVRAQN